MRSSQPFERAELRLDSRRYQGARRATGKTSNDAMATALPGGSVSGASMRSSQPFERAELRLESRRYQGRAANDFVFAICCLLSAISFEPKARMTATSQTSF